MMIIDMAHTPLISILEALAKRGAIRQLDYQFARFIARQCEGASSDLSCLQPDHDLVGFIAGVVSHEMGKGHICVELAHADFAAMLGLYGESAHQLNSRVANIDWRALFVASAVVGLSMTNGPSAVSPLIFDGTRLYLHRYWHYEVVLADRLNSLSAPVALSSSQRTNLAHTLNHLFARQYLYLFNALKELEQSGKSSAVSRQQLVCDHLDIVKADEVDWEAVDALLQSVHHTSELNKLDDLVPESVCLNWQKVAAAVAVTRRFAVISGGPGTGKTTTVTKLLSALIEQAHSENIVPTIKLVAPTGKAAARLTESIGSAVDKLPLDPHIKALIPTESSTLHRLLGAIPNRAEFRHNKDNLIHVDVLVIDEASMIDLSMMFKLMDALPSHTRVILLGDKDQLSSVEAGAVLGDICSFNSSGNMTGFSPAQSKLIAELTSFHAITEHSSQHPNQTVSSISDSLCMLQKSYRFDARSGIGQLAKAVNSGSVTKLDSVLAKGFSDIERYVISSENYHLMLKTLVKEYGRYLKRANDLMTLTSGETESQEQKAKAVLSLFSQCRLLCAIRDGDYGVVGLNHRIEQALVARRFIQTQDELWYHGRPVMVTRNDHALGLYNGDIGICLRDESEDVVRLKVYFELPNGSVKSILPSRVPEHETAYAMTIHKSQGSEFDLTLMILPPDYLPILTRELIYTGLTRAKSRLMLFADEAVLKRGVRVKTERVSGLVDRLLK